MLGELPWTWQGSRVRCPGQGAGFQVYLPSPGTPWNIVYETPREKRVRAHKGEGRCLHSNQNLGREVGAPLEDDGERTEEGRGQLRGLRGPEIGT